MCLIILYFFVPSARHGFINCVLVTTHLKCRKEETLFITRIADMLSNMRVYSPDCKSINVTLCSSAQPVLKNVISISFTLLQILSCLTLSIVCVHVWDINEEYNVKSSLLLLNRSTAIFREYNNTFSLKLNTLFC